MGTFYRTCVEELQHHICYGGHGPSIEVSLKQTWENLNRRMQKGRVLMENAERLLGITVWGPISNRKFCSLSVELIRK